MAKSLRTITAVKERPRGRVAVELNGLEWRVFPTEVVVRAGLTSGVELDRVRLRTLARELRRSKALATAARALRHRDLSTRTLGERLSRAGVTSATRAETIETLSRAGFLNDERFAVARARSLVERNMGDAAIRHDLEQHGVDAETAERAFAELPPESERVGRVLARRGCSPATARYLARRGFCADAVAVALGEVAPDP